MRDKFAKSTIQEEQQSQEADHDHDPTMKLGYRTE